MGKKSKIIQTELNKVLEKVKESERLLQEAELEEKAKLDTMQEQIDNECTKLNVFCGVILTPDDIATIVKMAILKNDSVKIPYHLYYNE